jgi:Predicted acetyltransferase
VVSTGGAYTMGQDIAVIGGLATLPDYRGRGYATQILHYLVDAVREQGKIPALFCAKESLSGYYMRNGFVPAGSWAELQLAAPKAEKEEQGEAK